MTITLTLNESGPLKRELIEMAYGQCGIVGYEFGHTPEEIADGLRLLEAMMREYPWSQLGYNHASYGAGDPAEHSNIDYDAQSAVALSLANRIAPTKGIALSPHQQAEMSRSRALLASQYATSFSMPYPRDTARGAGNRHGSPFINESVDDA